MRLKNFIRRAADAFNIRNLVIFAMPISIAVLIIMLFNFSQTVEHLSHELIKRTINKTHMELDDFFDPVVNNLIITRDLGQGGVYENTDPAILNPLFLPFLKNSKQVSSMLIANTKGEEYMLLEEDSTWQNRSTTYSGDKKKVERLRWKYNDNLRGTIVERWSLPEDKSNNPLTKKWFLAAFNNKDIESISWTNPYSFKTTKEPGITASTKWNSASTNEKYVAAFDVLLTDISKYTTNLEVSKNGKAIVFTDQGEIVGLPADIRFFELDSIKKYVLKSYDSLQIPIVELALKEWKSKSNITTKPFNFKSEDGLWWCGIEKFELNSEKSFFIAVIVPEADFLAEVNRTRIVIIAGFLLVTVLTLLVIKGYNQKRKDNELLQKQKREIERQRDEIGKQRDIVTKQKDQIDKIHSELKSSINYAQKIQQAVLPDEKLLNKIFPNHFVIYRPHSVVSGDFYWATAVNSKLIFTAADCTGHGVPGAFMSMLGVSFLNDIVNKKDITTAGQVLDLLRENVVQSLKQNTNINDSNTGMGLKDGMDISLCVLDSITLELQYAGANNPLYIIRNKEINSNKIENLTIDQSNEMMDLYEIKADKMPIAIYEKMNSFKTNIVKVDSGDRLFMFSDGFIDQFGGKKGKKFMSKPFKNLILETSTLEMQEQKNEIISTFIQWISEIDENGEPYHQIDDVVILSVLV